MINKSILFDSTQKSFSNKATDLDFTSTINNDADEQASMLFKALFGNYLKTHKAYIALARGTAGGPPNCSEYFRDIHLAACRIADLRMQDANTFFAVAPRCRAGQSLKLSRYTLI